MRFVLPFFLVVFLLLSPVLSFAQETTNDVSIGIASFVSITDPDATNGAIVAFQQAGYVLASRAYDPTAVGVITETPAVALTIEGEQNSYPIVSSGTVNVNVSTINGPIKKGDLVTTSTIKGVGMKATNPGIVLGVAEGSFNAKTTKEIGKVPVTLNVHYFTSTEGNAPLQQSLKDVMNLSILAATERPSVVFKHVVAAVILVTCIILGFFSFARIANNGIRALGRNPLAGKMIEFGIFLNVMITILIMGSGLFLAYMVLNL